MSQAQIDFFVQYLLFPAVVALLTAFLSAVATYKATYKLNKKTKEDEQHLKREDLVEKLLIEVSRLVPLFEKLNSDFNKDNYYAFANIDLISNARWRLVNLNNDVTLFDYDLRKQILENADNVSTLIDELNALERNPAQGFADLKSKLEEAIREDRHLRLELLKMGVMIENNDDGKLVARYINEELPKYTKSKKNLVKGVDKKLEAIEIIRSTLLSGVTGAQKQLDDVNADTARKRDRLVARIIDVQNKLKDFQDTLQEMKEN